MYVSIIFVLFRLPQCDQSPLSRSKVTCLKLLEIVNRLISLINCPVSILDIPIDSCSCCTLKPARLHERGLKIILPCKLLEI